MSDWVKWQIFLLYLIVSIPVNALIWKWIQHLTGFKW